MNALAATLTRAAARCHRQTRSAPVRYNLNPEVLVQLRKVRAGWANVGSNYETFNGIRVVGTLNGAPASITNERGDEIIIELK